MSAKVSCLQNCCGVRAKYSETPILIENSGRQFRICKPDALVQRKEEHQRLLEAARERRQKQEEERLRALAEQEQRRMELRKRVMEADAKRKLERERYDELEAFRDPSERTCFDCKSNLTWMNKRGLQTVVHTKAWGYQRTLHRIWQEPAEVSREKYNRHPAYATYKIEFISKFDKDREAEEFAVLKCLSENRKVCPCIVCNNLTRNIGEDNECFIGKIGDLSCKNFILYPLIRTHISSKYKDAKVKDNIDTSSVSGKLMMHIFASLAEFERDLIVERTQAGRKAAMAKGKKMGRPKLKRNKKAKATAMLYEKT